MKIDWERAVDEILADKITCQRCGTLHGEAIVGYTRSPAAADFAPRCRDCDRREDCNERKLIVVCEDCARALRLRGRRVDQEGVMSVLMTECRRELEDCIDYLADLWREELDIDPDDLDLRFEDADPEAFAEETKWRRRLEDEYMGLHRWFREHHRRVPDPGWRTEYAEEIIALGYETSLGD